MIPSKVALVGPRFFSYTEAIRDRLKSRGYESQFFDERHANSVRARSLYRIGYYTLFAARKNRHLDGIVAAILRGGFESVLLIGVEVCDARFVRQLTAAGVRVHLYMWDSAKNKPRFLSYLDLLGGKSSFDPQDCRSFGLTYIPLFAEDEFSTVGQESATRDRPVDLAFCGTLHSNRATRISQLLNFCRRRHLRIELMLYFHSRWLLALKSLRHLSNARFVRTVSTTGFPKREIFELFSRSKFVLDLPHPGQIGLTARTFEALRAGTFLITFNETARSHLPGSFQERVHVIASIDDLAKIDFDGSRPAQLSKEQDRYLSLDRFIDQILALMN
jgi:hypothetical protein